MTTKSKTSIYKQGASKECVGEYLLWWLRWAGKTVILALLLFFYLTYEAKGDDYIDLGILLTEYDVGCMKDPLHLLNDDSIYCKDADSTSIANENIFTLKDVIRFITMEAKSSCDVYYDGEGMIWGITIKFKKYKNDFGLNHNNIGALLPQDIIKKCKKKK